ncbi:MAG: thiaminase II [Rhodovibrionaceae bacterium]|nr:thiaminase II [Rhodovibrionaceae bacterium]
MTASSIYEALKASCADDWQAYTGHEFVARLAEGSLPEPAFRYYLIQDYLFLRHFSRAYALAVYKADEVADMRQAAATLGALINDEMSLHVDYCARWGIGEAEMAAAPEHPANMAYTRYVLERGMAGDLLDLLVALSPCVAGYGEIGRRLAGMKSALSLENPYRNWVETYGGDDYQSVARASVEQLDRVAAARIGADASASPRWPELARTFRDATRLEIGFWQMGLDAA